MESKNSEILKLADEILKNIELSEIPLQSIALKCTRLARITNNQNAMNLFQYELAGYPKDNNGYIPADAFNLARYANRVTYDKEKNDELMFSETVAELESQLESAKVRMTVAYDRDVSISSSNPVQHVYAPMGNFLERSTLSKIISDTSKKINQLKAAYHNYALGVYYELKFSGITEGIFEKRKLSIDNYLLKNLPETLGKFVSAYENLRSKNQEDWANAVHSCRRIIKDIADFLYPPCEEEIEVNGKKYKLNEERYIMRLKQFIKQKSSSEKFIEIVGSHLDYIGDRVDSIYEATTKGSHAVINQDEAERYVIYSYLLLGDIISLGTWKLLKYQL